MTFTGFTPHTSQRDVIKSILTDPAKFHIATIGRQWGKSLMGMNLALYWMINQGPCKVLWVSPVYSQTSKVHKELYGAIAASGVVKTNNFSDNRIELKNGSEIVFRSAERYDNIRGMTMDYGIIDEAAFMKDDAWKEAIRPVFAVRGKKVLFISTPKGKNWFYDLYQLGKSPDNQRYKSYTGSSYETPYISEEEIEDARKTLPEQVFKQEYKAEFIDAGGSVFQNLQDCSFDRWPNPQGKVYCGIDLGRAEDFTVATFMDSTGQVIGVVRVNQEPWATIVKQILEKIRQYNATVMIEVNSIGDVVYEMIKKEWQDTHPFVTTAKSKNEIIEGLIVDFNENLISIPSETLFGPLWHELEIFTYEYNPKTRSIRYGHPTGMHDDTVLSLAIVNYNRKQNKSLGSYAVMGRGRY